MAATRQARRLDEPVEADVDVTLAERIADPDAEDPWERAEVSEATAQIRAMLAVLEPRERTVLAGRFPAAGAPRTLAAIGGELGMSTEAIRQIEHRAIGKLRCAFA
jgi:RNA polymerase sigma factor (sigma-70 family)